MFICYSERLEIMFVKTSCLPRVSVCNGGHALPAPTRLRITFSRLVIFPFTHRPKSPHPSMQSTQATS